MKPEYLRIAVVLGTHGLNGRLKIRIISDFPERFDCGATVYFNLEGSYKKGVITYSNIINRSEALVEIDWINNFETAERLKGLEMCVSTDEINLKEQLSEDEFYYYELIGATVCKNGSPIGKIIDLVSAGSNDIIVIEHNGKEFLVPFISEMVDTSRIKEGIVDIHPIDGIIE